MNGFMDVDWVGFPSERKSTSGGIFSIGSTTVSWYSRKQRSVALSSAEAEYMVASQDTCEAISMRNILVGFFGSQLDSTVIHCDNQSFIKISINIVFHDRSKNIYIYIYIYLVPSSQILCAEEDHVDVPKEDQDADILMKALTRRKFEYHRDKIRVKDNPFLFERKC